MRIERRKEHGIPTNGLLLEYLFSNNLLDTSSSSNDASDIGGAGISYTDDRHGNPSSALRITSASPWTQGIGSGSTVALSGTSNFTICFWVRLSTPPATTANTERFLHVGFGNRDTSPTYTNIPVNISKDSSGNYIGGYRGTSGFYTNPVDLTGIDDGNYHFIAFRGKLDTGFFRDLDFVFDGVKTAFVSQLAIDLDPVPFAIGVWSDETYTALDNELTATQPTSVIDYDNVRVYSRYVSDAELDILLNE